MNRRNDRRPTGADLHRAWLELVDTDGPFLAVPALKRVWPTGMPQPRTGKELAALRDARPAFEKAWDRWDTQPRRHGRRRGLPAGARRLGGRGPARRARLEDRLRDGADAAATRIDRRPGTRRAGPLPDCAVTVRPTGALVHRDTIGALVLVIDPVDSLRDPLADGWAASPIDRMEELLRTADVQIGVVTDGRWWAIVCARPQTMLASGIIDALTWTEAPATRNAFIELLRRIRLIGGSPEDRLTELFEDSVAAAEEITEALGTQVRRAVELLVQALSEAALDARRRGQPDPLPADRDRGLPGRRHGHDAGGLPALRRGTRPAAAGHAVHRRLRHQRRARRPGRPRINEEGSEALDATHLTWHRLLATSQALYRGRLVRGHHGCRPTAGRCSTRPGSRSSPPATSTARWRSPSATG